MIWKLEDITIDGATGIIINITANNSVTTHEINQAVSLVMEAADEEAEIIFGTVINDQMGEEMKVTVIATGLEQKISMPKVLEKVILPVEPPAPPEELFTQPELEINPEPTTIPVSEPESVVLEAPRVRTLEEKLGFINFDDEEFDTPAFLRRKDRPQPEMNS